MAERTRVEPSTDMLERLCQWEVRDPVHPIAYVQVRRRRGDWPEVSIWTRGRAEVLEWGGAEALELARHLGEALIAAANHGADFPDSQEPF